MNADRKNLIRDFHRKCDSYLKKVEETKSFLTEQLTDLNENNIYESLKSEILKLHIAFQCIHVPQNLHQCRNNLKGLIYSYKCLGRESRNKLCLNIKYLKELEKNIGQWHDISILVKTLSKSKNQKFKKSIKRLSVKSKKRFEKCRALAEQFLEKSIKESNTSNRQDQFT